MITATPLLYKNKTVLGIDLGTSGLRACVVNKSQDTLGDIKQTILAECSVPLESATKQSNGQITQNPKLWITAFNQLLNDLKERVSLKEITHLVVDATSSTVLLLDQQTKIFTDAFMYSDNHAVKQAKKIEEAYQKHDLHHQAQSSIIDSTQTALGASSTLAKVMSLLELNPHIERPIICHQADFINYYLCGVTNVTDENNALKLGYNLTSQTPELTHNQPNNQAWQNWIMNLLTPLHSQINLPKVVSPGDYLAKILPQIAQQYGLSKNLKVMAGTTDSIAGFLAVGTKKAGDAVTSLGSTIAIKSISKQAVYNSKLGLYSHKLKDDWLVGGASNAGGQVLLTYYSIEQLSFLNQQISQEEITAFLQSNPKDYYPLCSVGERFPISDSQLQPRLPHTPNCEKDDIYFSESCLQSHKQFLLRLLYGLTLIEQLSYQKLEEITNTEIKNIYTVGGGIKSPVWMSLRQKVMKSKQFKPVLNTQAAYGVTQLVL
ncbi:FGGY-family carbohydrate kinase [Thiomicrorhabdus hydrogeniphila]